MNDTITLLCLEGSLDITRSDWLRQEVSAAIEQSHQRILIDFERVSFIDSAGLSTMVMALKKCREVGIQLALCALGDQVELLFRLTGMEKVFDIFESQAAFERSLQAE